jgi:outer membrane biosynthesis protein TonB
MYLDVGELFSPKLKDSGHAVFDFVEIGPKSKSPILSENEGRVSKTKSQETTDVPSRSKNKQPTKNSPATENPPKEKADAIPLAPKKPQKKPLPKKMQPQKPKTPSKSKPPEKPKKATQNVKKNTSKAVVNLDDRKKKNINSKTAKKSFDSLLDSATAETSHENTGMKAEEVGETLTATQVDLIRQTIRKCWHFPAGLKNADALIVDIKMSLDPEGNVKSAEIVDKKRMKNDPNFKVAAEYAYRAVLDPICNPLPLPKEKYEEWKELELSFNPKDMFD